MNFDMKAAARECVRPAVKTVVTLLALALASTSFVGCATKTSYALKTGKNSYFMPIATGETETITVQKPVTKTKHIARRAQMDPFQGNPHDGRYDDDRSDQDQRYDERHADDGFYGSEKVLIIDKKGRVLTDYERTESQEGNWERTETNQTNYNHKTGKIQDSNKVEYGIGGKKLFNFTIKTNQEDEAMKQRHKQGYADGDEVIDTPNGKFNVDTDSFIRTKRTPSGSHNKLGR